jgi:NDP-sugar pyrophosphorylase family protein
MNILFPVGGKGERFQGKYNVPKPLVEVGGKSILYWSIKTLGLDGNYIFVTLEYTEQKYNDMIYDIIKGLIPNATILKIKKPTSGSAFTCLVAEHLINNQDDLIITNCDQYLNWDCDKFLDFLKEENADVVVSIYDHGDIVVGEKSPYCFVRTDSSGYIKEFREKFAISELSMNGIHYWKRGSDFVESCKKMIQQNITVNGEYYLSSSFKFLIESGFRILPFKMNEGEFFSLGTPDDIDKNYNKIL